MYGMFKLTKNLLQINFKIKYISKKFQKINISDQLYTNRIAKYYLYLSIRIQEFLEVYVIHIYFLSLCSEK